MNKNKEEDSGVKILQPIIENYKSEIVEIISSTNTDQKFPDYKVKILEGPEKDKIIETYSNGILHNTGERVFLQHTKENDGSEYYNLGESIRYNSLIFSLLFFIVVVVLIFGKKA